MGMVVGFFGHCMYNKYMPMIKAKFAKQVK